MRPEKCKASKTLLCAETSIRAISDFNPASRSFQTPTLDETWKFLVHATVKTKRCVGSLHVLLRQPGRPAMFFVTFKRSKLSDKPSGPTVLYSTLHVYFQGPWFEKRQKAQGIQTGDLGLPRTPQIRALPLVQIWTLRSFDTNFSCEHVQHPSIHTPRYNAGGGGSWHLYALYRYRTRVLTAVCVLL